MRATCGGGLRGTDRDEAATALAAANRVEPAADAGEFASIAATAREGHTLDFGPLFNPTKYLAAPADEIARVPETEREPDRDDERTLLTHAERRDALRGELRALVSRASVLFAVDHKLIHATLNKRFSGPVATATLAGLEARRRLVTSWIERRTYDGLR